LYVVALSSSITTNGRQSFQVVVRPVSKRFKLRLHRLQVHKPLNVIWTSSFIIGAYLTQHIHTSIYSSSETKQHKSSKPTLKCTPSKQQCCCNCLGNFCCTKECLIGTSQNVKAWSSHAAK